MASEGKHSAAADPASPANCTLALGDTLRLRRGFNMPRFGLGTWLSQNNGEARAACTAALAAGYPMIDTAQFYGNEADVGAAVAAVADAAAAAAAGDAPPTRRPFIVTKLKGDAHEKGSVTRALKRSLQLLQLAQVDLFLVHSPRGMRCVDTWREMLACRDAGLAASVGVSNFGRAHIEGLVAAGLELPEVNQIELHPWLQQTEFRAWMQEHGIAVMGYCPLARCKQFGKTPALTAVAEARGVSEAAVCIRWSLEEGAITIPKSSNPERISQNAQVFAMAPFTEEEKAALRTCDCGFKASSSVNAQDEPWDTVK